MTTATRYYDVLAIYRDGAGNPAGTRRYDIEAASPEEALELAKEYESDSSEVEKYSEADIEILDSETDEVLARGSATADPNQAKIDALNVLHKDVREYQTDFAAVEYEPYDGGIATYYHWRRNGGSRGAFDRTCGDGRWRNPAPEPEEITAAEAVRILVEEHGLDLSAIDALADEVPDSDEWRDAVDDYFADDE